MSRGGFRPNAGIKKGMVYPKTLEKQALRQVVYDFVEKNMSKILNALLERSQGVQAINDQGKIYNLPPDPQAAKILIEHAIGKPPESMDLTSNGNELKATTINVIKPDGDKLPTIE